MRKKLTKKYLLLDKNNVKVMYNICGIYRGVGHKMIPPSPFVSADINFHRQRLTVILSPPPPLPGVLLQYSSNVTDVTI